MAINKTYEELVESGKQKLTTDDCYTPDNIYSVVLDYVAERYGRRRCGWNSMDGVTIELSAHERALVYGE